MCTSSLLKMITNLVHKYPSIFGRESTLPQFDTAMLENWESVFTCYKLDINSWQVKYELPE